MGTKNKDKLVLDNWKRREHFEFFKSFAQPYWGVTSNINCTQAFAYCKSAKVSFFMYYLFQSLKVVNQLKEFKYRIEGGEVFEYKKISGSITVLRNDETFGFAYFDYLEDFVQFSNQTNAKIAAVKVTSGLHIQHAVNDIVYYSLLPGINFTSLQHALNYSNNSIPLITFGKFHECEGRMNLPISVHVHHALCDGLHMEKFINAFQEKMELSST
jgi:chloramphenicol O-acetyltransferase type A